MTEQGRKRILVVDDDTPFLTMLSGELETQGHEVSTAGDGDEALTRLGGNRFDLVLLDIDMPRRNGLEVLKIVKDNYPATRVIMLTGYGNYANVVAARRLDADAFIEKPCDLVILLGTIDRILAS